MFERTLVIEYLLQSRNKTIFWNPDEKLYLWKSFRENVVYLGHSNTYMKKTN